MSVQLTGKVFVPNKTLMPEGGKFQLEAIIDGVTTRLEGSGEVSEACLFDNRHSGLQVTAVLESYPPQYEVKCSCGKAYYMHDQNARMELLK